MLRELEAQPEPGRDSSARHRPRSAGPPHLRRHRGRSRRARAGSRSGQARNARPVPSHKSHVDYLMLSFVFYDAQPAASAHRGRRQPVVLSARARSFAAAARSSSGARSRGDRLYAAVVDAYIRRLIREGYSHRVLPRGRALAHRQAAAAQARPAQHGGRRGARGARQGASSSCRCRIGYDRLVEEQRLRARAHRRREAERRRPRPAQDDRRAARSLRTTQHPVRRDPVAARHPQRTATRRSRPTTATARQPGQTKARS